MNRTSNPYVVKPSVPGWGNATTMGDTWMAARGEEQA